MLTRSTSVKRIFNNSMNLAALTNWKDRASISVVSRRHQHGGGLASNNIKGHGVTTDYSTKKVFRAIETSQLWRSLFILKLSSIDFFVSYSEKILLLGTKLLWRPLFDKIMMKTFYGHFAGGESIETCKVAVAKLQHVGIRAMLMVPIESIPCCTEDEEERIMEANFDSLKGCIHDESMLEKNGFAQMKLTAISNKQLLMEMNKLLAQYEKDHKEPLALDIQHIANYLEEGKYDKIYVPELGDQLSRKLQVLLKRCNNLAELCKEKNVRLMIDAEQTYIQGALGYLTLVLQAKFNKDKLVVYNTYQCFRKDTLDRIKADCQLAEDLGFKNAGKLVRGAYMVEERRLAKEGCYDDPICDTFDDTTNMYHSCVDFLLPLVTNGDAGTMIASHNEDTVDFVKDRMATYGISKCSNYICFGQVLGMCDHVSYSLAEDGYKPYKTIPYGPIDDTILYLSRRAQENRSVIERTVFERRLIRSELKGRLKGLLW